MIDSFIDRDGLPNGSRWLHFWTQTDAGDPRLWLAMQFEIVGVRITAAPCLRIEPTACMVFFDLLAALPNSKRVPEGVSLRLDDQSESE